VSQKKPTRVAIVMGALSDFRVPFYETLRIRLLEQGVELDLLYGTEDHWSRHLDWARPFDVVRLPLGTTWYPVFSRLLGDVDLVVTEDASRRLINYCLLAARRFGGPKVMVWGHGWNHQVRDLNTVPERLKRFVSRRADGVLAYTAGVREGLLALGYDGNRVFNVQNAAKRPDVTVSSEQVARHSDSLGLPPDHRVVFCCGKMYPMKRLDLLVDAILLAKQNVPNLHLVLAGAGPSQHVAEQAAARHAFIHYVGPVFDTDKALCYAVSDVSVLPGAVGLGIVDSFHHGVPLIATTMASHGPEIEYLEHETNGLLTEHTPEALAAGIERLLSDRLLYQRLVAGCQAASSRITIDGMVERFMHGVLATLRAEPVKAGRRWSYE
jgi:glycosyltransferase involved in cell wall biosynthesis